ncbi:unnamed protein product [Ceratitis capitata]|uniref:Protein-lysine N-methyltransferase CCAP1982_LOCUS11327 n=1 Tax=Ceratitis capitata TaxID=7213 RepID=W8BQ09_CERCA|nr:unnamed protein product [Ceratitis capitata]
MSIDELSGSELGTKTYWDRSYNEEIANYKNHGDVGTIWFDEDSQFRVINWILKQETISSDVSIIDMGCGNGMLLIELAREGFSNLLGVDYSENAIKLAKQIAKDQELNIRYQSADLLNTKLCQQQLGTFSIVHDKGTYDAISLCPENPKEKREAYLSTVNCLMNENSLFILTSCNWTEDELLISLADKFIKKCCIPTPTFKFGGKTGSVVTSMVFTKKII